MKQECSFIRTATTVGLATLFGSAQLAHGGFTGGVNGLGNGWVQGSVVTAARASGLARTLNKSYPTASVPFRAGYTDATAGLPSGAQAVSTAYVRAQPGVPYNMSGYQSPYNGDTADNKEIEAKGVPIKPGKCPTLELASEQDFFDAGTGNGAIKVITQGTTGAALLLRGFEVPATEDLLAHSDNPLTAEDESVDWLKSKGTLKFEVFLIGPFNYDTCPLILPFTLESKDTKNFVFTVDGATYSEQSLHFTCPPAQTVACLAGYQYPSVTPTSDCTQNPVQSYELKYEPAESALQVGDNNVKLTVTELLADNTRGVSSSCTFKVTVQPDAPPTVPVLPDLIGACGGSVPLIPPTTTDSCTQGTITGTTTSQSPITAKGTNIVTWAFTDSAGHTSFANQRVIIPSYTFIGFYAPISVSGGTCQKTAKDIKVGSKTPIKFDVKCGSQFVTTGPKPVVGIQQLSNNCNPVGSELLIPADYQNDWHSNWDSTGFPTAKYRITAYLPDGTTGVVYINLVK